MKEESKGSGKLTYLNPSDKKQNVRFFRTNVTLGRAGSVVAAESIHLDELDPSTGLGDSFELGHDCDPVGGGQSCDQQALVDKVKVVIWEGQTLNDVVLDETAVAWDDGCWKDARHVDAGDDGVWELVCHFLSLLF